LAYSAVFPPQWDGVWGGASPQYKSTSRCRPLGGYSLIDPVRSLCC